MGIVLESSTWRANPDSGARLGYPDDELRRANEQAIRLLEDIRDEYEDRKTTVVISGMIGPHGDGYDPKIFMAAPQAEEYHEPQIRTFSRTNANMVGAQTMTYVEEAVGIVRAAKKWNMPVMTHSPWRPMAICLLVNHWEARLPESTLLPIVIRSIT